MGTHLAWKDGGQQNLLTVPEVRTQVSIPGTDFCQIIEHDFILLLTYCFLRRFGENPVLNNHIYHIHEKTGFTRAVREDGWVGGWATHIPLSWAAEGTCSW